MNFPHRFVVVSISFIKCIVAVSSPISAVVDDVEAVGVIVSEIEAVVDVFPVADVDIGVDAVVTVLL